VDWIDIPPGEPVVGAVRAAIEERTGQPLAWDDPLPVELIATVQALQRVGCSLGALEMWIRFADHPEGWSTRAFAYWFIRNHCPDERAAA
jgi:hypothetical protein